MDAANPLCRWLLAAGLAAAAGCQTDGASTLPRARGQGPGEPVAPLPPPPQPPPAGPVAPGTPVAGTPVGPVTTTGYTASLPNPARAADLLQQGTPRIKVIAHVGTSNHVTDQEVIEAVRQRRELMLLDGHDRAAREKELFADELRRIIERELILDDMYARLKKNGMAAKIDEIKEFAGKAADQNLRAIRKEFQLTADEEFHSWLYAQGLSLPVLRRQIERQMMADEYVRSMLKEKGRQPGLAEIRAYYDRHPDEFRAEDRVKWQDIFVSFNRHPSPRAAYDHALAVQRQAAAGADFVALVREHDNGLAAGNNGLGVGSKRGEIQPIDVEPTVWALRPGQVSGLVETPAGYHIVKVVERDYAGVRPFDDKVQAEVREKLIKQYRQDEYRKMVQDLWWKIPVRVIQAP